MSTGRRCRNADVVTALELINLKINIDHTRFATLTLAPPVPRKPASSKPPERRSPGRPAAGQPGQRERILDAATDLFSRQGVAGTPVKAIATLAGVTPALVHYYFGGRDLLLDAVIEEKVQPLVARFFATSQADDEPLAMLVGIATRLIRAVAEAPWFPGLWIREVASDDGAARARAQALCAGARGRLMAPLAAAIARGSSTPGWSRRW